MALRAIIGQVGIDEVGRVVDTIDVERKTKSRQKWLEERKRVQKINEQFTDNHPFVRNAVGYPEIQVGSLPQPPEEVKEAFRKAYAKEIEEFRKLGYIDMFDDSGLFRVS